MSFVSILYDGTDSPPPASIPEPAFFHDLNLDRVVTDMTTGRDEYDLTPFLRLPPDRIETALYRQDVMRDLEQQDVLASINSFSQKMRSMREQRSRIDKLFYQLQKERVFLDAIAFYCDAVTVLRGDLSKANLRSQGLIAFRDYVSIYVRSDAFKKLQWHMEEIKAALSRVEYQLQIQDGSVTVSRRGSEADYGAAIAHTFARFRQGAPKKYEFKSPNYLEMNHIEAGILEFVAHLFPDIFSRLSEYFHEHQDYLDAVIARWDREIQFYICYLDYIRPLQNRELSFSYPILSSTSKAILAKRTFDIALAHKLVAENAPIVTNDLEMQGVERILVVSGPNQGGKTTFARTFGQLHYLARLGFPVPGANTRLFFYDKLLTHFEKEDDIRTHRGKLEDEIVRTYEIVQQATSQSIVILNEVFTSTTLYDALFLARSVIDRLIKLDLLCVCVTFMDELSTLGPTTVSLVSEVIPANPTERTYRVIRRKADGKSYALSIAEKYRLTYRALKERLSP